MNQGRLLERLTADWGQACQVWVRNPIVQSNQVGPNYDLTAEHALCLELAKKYRSQVPFFLEKLSDQNPILATYAMKVLMRIRTPAMVIPETLFTRTEIIHLAWRDEVRTQSLGDYLEAYKEFDPEVLSTDIWDERWNRLRDTKAPEALFKRGQIVIKNHPRKGVVLMRKAMKRGYTDAACFLCDAYTFEECSPQIPVNPKKALVYHKILAKTGDLESAACVLRHHMNKKWWQLEAVVFYIKMLADATDYPESVKPDVKWLAGYMARKLREKDPAASASYRAKADAIMLD